MEKIVLIPNYKRYEYLGCGSVVNKNTKYIIPVIGEGLDKITKYDNVMYILSEKKILNVFRDKNKFYDYVRELGFDENVPEQYYDKNDIKYPCIYKQVGNYCGKGVFILKSPKDLEKVINWRGIENYSKNYLLQELIKGPIEYSSIFLSYNGKVEYELHARYTYNKDMYVYPRVKCLKIESLKDIECDKSIFYKIIEQSNFHGLCNFNYKIKNGRIIIFESNPRLGADITDHPIDKQKELFNKYMQLVDKSQ